jgi:hypothetical protein
VEGAVADLERDGQSRAAAAATLDGAFVEHVVGTCAAVRVLRRLDERVRADNSVVGLAGAGPRLFVVSRAREYQIAPKLAGAVLCACREV